METTVYNQTGAKSGKTNLPENIFSLPWNADLVNQVVFSMLSNQRAGTAHTKTRGEVSGGGKKPWKQKGTGRARHGSRRSPLWKGGGTTFGPQNTKNYDRKINRKMKVKALFTVLSQKMRDREIIFVDKINLPEIKTKDAKEVLNSFGKIDGMEKLPKKRKNALVLAMSGKDEKVKKSFGNFSNIFVSEVKDLSPVELLNYKYIAIVNPEDSFATLSKKQS